MKAAAAALLAVALAATLAACGDDSKAQRTARACAGASTGAAALHGPGRIEDRVHRAEDTAADAARALPQGDRDNPADSQAHAVRVMLDQSLRLRLVRSQIQREERAPQEVLDAAASGLTAGDRLVRQALAAAGVRC